MLVYISILGKCLNVFYSPGNNHGSKNDKTIVYVLLFSVREIMLGFVSFWQTISAAAAGR